jgi:protease-4
MALDTDLLIERRRLKRRLSLWRALAVVAVIAALAVGVRIAAPGGGLPGQAHVARLNVRGFISDDRRVVEAIDRAARDSNVRALVLAIDSPGGSMAGGEGLYQAIRRFAEAKPVIAVMGGTGASAAYMIAMPAHRVLARDSTLTGSIGVLMQSFDLSELMTRLGVRPETLTSGPLKNQPGLFNPLSEEGRALLQHIIADLHGQFVAMVAQGRRMEEARVRELADGRIYTGREAVTLGLIDAIGGEREARAWLAAERQVAETLPIRDLATRSTTERLLEQTVGTVINSVVSEWLGVDGPRAVWQR